MYLIAFPLLLIPFVLYNMIIFLLNMPFSEVVFSIPLLEGRRLPVTTGDLLVMHSDGISERFAITAAARRTDLQLLADRLASEHGKLHDDQLLLIVQDTPETLERTLPRDADGTPDVTTDVTTDVTSA